jgi:cytochrome oxidase Cu insertion factor (SCO1/SenC/PrrC family)
MRNRPYVVQIVLVGIILLMAARPSMALKIGDKAPDFDLTSSTGENIKLADYLGKKPVVLFFYIGAFTNT